MSKRRTKKEKVIAQLRRKLATTDVLETRPIQKDTYSFSAPSFVEKNYQKHTTEAHPYFLSDLFKTIILTSSIIVIELILFFISKR